MLTKKSVCPICKGKKTVKYLISLYGYETEVGSCLNCDGLGVINIISLREEFY